MRRVLDIRCGALLGLAAPARVGLLPLGRGVRRPGRGPRRPSAWRHHRPCRTRPLPRADHRQAAPRPGRPRWPAPRHRRAVVQLVAATPTSTTRSTRWRASWTEPTVTCERERWRHPRPGRPARRPGPGSGVLGRPRRLHLHRGGAARAPTRTATAGHAHLLRLVRDVPAAPRCSSPVPRAPGRPDDGAWWRRTRRARSSPWQLKDTRRDGPSPPRDRQRPRPLVGRGRGRGAVVVQRCSSAARCRWPTSARSPSPTPSSATRRATPGPSASSSTPTRSRWPRTVRSLATPLGAQLNGVGSQSLGQLVRSGHSIRPSAAARGRRLSGPPLGRPVRGRGAGVGEALAHALARPGRQLLGLVEHEVGVAGVVP